MHKEGFQYTTHKKGLYYNGHNRPNVVAYRQNIFIPFLKSMEHRLIRYMPENIDKEMQLVPRNYVERRLVLCAHDEMTAQANDARSKSWVYEDNHPLRKKGVGRGIHKSDVICSTVGWLEEASQTLEYGKNYEGYWTGQLFVAQLKNKIIPAFEKAHGAGYQALFFIDNSQGHSAYAEDALIATHMNVNPGGKQPLMRRGGFYLNEQKYMQDMVFGNDHPSYPNSAKGIKQFLQERELYCPDLHGKCNKCDADSDAICCNKRILESQEDFKAQKSLVEEVIKAAGHLCILLPKF